MCVCVCVCVCLCVSQILSKLKLEIKDRGEAELEQFPFNSLSTLKRRGIMDKFLLRLLYLSVQYCYSGIKLFNWKMFESSN